MLGHMALALISLFCRLLLSLCKNYNLVEIGRKSIVIGERSKEIMIKEDGKSHAYIAELLKIPRTIRKFGPYVLSRTYIIESQNEKA